LLGTPPSGGPEAELWLGAHPGSPSAILDPSKTGGADDLAEWVARDPRQALGADAPAGAGGSSARLPFLLKVLAADIPLSIQAHPSPEQALTGFERENELGVPLMSPDRNYKDPWHKPELIYALSPTFEALCGFRRASEAAAAVIALERIGAQGSEALEDFHRRLVAVETDPEGLRDVVAWVLGGDPAVAVLVRALTAVAEAVDKGTDRDAGSDSSARAADEAGTRRDADTIRRAATAFPGDPGIAMTLLLNRITLSRGEVLYLPAGNVHAYLEGVGIELMAASDNVLRGGLTPKHIDVPELLRVVEFASRPVPLLRPERPSRGVEVYRPDVPDFELTHVALGDGWADAEVALSGPAIALCTSGSFELRGRTGTQALSRGESVFVTPDERTLSVHGAGTVFVATPNSAGEH
jgi:mannose-6-phosphate isomerase